MKWFHRKTPPYVQTFLDYVNAHDDWECNGYVVRREGGKFGVWISSGAKCCRPVVGLLNDMPFPIRYRRALYNTAMDAAARTIRKATPVKGSDQ